MSRFPREKKLYATAKQKCSIQWKSEYDFCVVFWALILMHCSLSWTWKIAIFFHIPLFSFDRNTSKMRIMTRKIEIIFSLKRINKIPASDGIQADEMILLRTPPLVFMAVCVYLYVYACNARRRWCHSTTGITLYKVKMFRSCRRQYPSFHDELCSLCDYSNFYECCHS